MANGAFILHCFTPFPTWLPLFLHSIQLNPNWDFLFIGNQKLPNINKPKNLIEINCTEKELFNRIEQKLKIHVKGKFPSLTTTKYEDYAPTYGFLFEDLLKNYPIWGLINFNTILGNLEKIIPNNIFYNAEAIIAPNNPFFILRNITVINYFFSRITNIDTMISNKKCYSLLNNAYSNLLQKSPDVKCKKITSVVETINPFFLNMSNNKINNMDNFILNLGNQIHTELTMDEIQNNNNFLIKNSKITIFPQ